MNKGGAKYQTTGIKIKAETIIVQTTLFFISNLEEESLIIYSLNLFVVSTVFLIDKAKNEKNNIPAKKNKKINLNGKKSKIIAGSIWPKKCPVSIEVLKGE